MHLEPERSLAGGFFNGRQPTSESFSDQGNDHGLPLDAGIDTNPLTGLVLDVARDGVCSGQLHGFAIVGARNRSLGDSHGGVIVIFTNQSKTTCSLFGYPGAADLDRNGRQ